MRSTMMALLKFSELCRDIPIVICDGSGYDFSNEQKLLKNKFSNLEFLSFHNDSERVRTLGKGYGEGQIVCYALAHSEILKKYDDFAKCTSKLWVSNYRACVDGFTGMAAFLTAPFFSPDKVDTRFYIVNKAFYFEHLLHAHEKVDDLNGFHLEHAFFNAIRGMPYRRVLGKNIPETYGHSGSVGIHFKPSKIKNLIKKSKVVLGVLSGRRV
ncbi:hypothetical protein [Pseudomonas sp. LRF_L74]|uniref:hypothetical protein n=1 Tax=Pseudomonas sp. LRF_L74 TaxID=3369422 RepID=UPI003F61728F